MLRFGSKQMLWECSELEAREMCPGGLPRQISPHGWRVKSSLPVWETASGIDILQSSGVGYFQSILNVP